MSLFRRITSLLTETREEENYPARSETDDFWFSPYIGGTSSGVHVTPQTAVGTTAVYACVSAIAQIIGMLPLITYERMKDGGRERATDSNWYWLLAVQPNQWMVSGELVELILVHLLLRGNAYVFKLRDRSGRVVQLIPLSCEKMKVQLLNTYELSYEYEFGDGRKKTFSGRDIMHFRIGMGDGVCGRSPISVAAETVGLTMAMEQHAGRFFSNAAKPSGVLQHPGTLDKETSDRIKESWQKAHAGLDAAWKVAVLEEGMTFNPITLPIKDMQFVEQRRFQLEEVARLFRVPPHIIGDLSRATFSNIEHQGINFVTYSLQPYCRRFEQVLMLNFFSLPINKKEYFAEFLVDSLQRGDFKSRQEGLEVQRRNGIISANEWRRLENLSAIDGKAGKGMLIPLNMIWADQMEEYYTPEEPAPDPQPNDGTPAAGADSANGDMQINSLFDVHYRAQTRALFADILERAIHREVAEGERARKKGTEEDKIEEQQRRYLSTALRLPVSVYSAYCGGVTQRETAGDPEGIVGEFWEHYKKSADKRGSVRALELGGILCETIEGKLGIYLNGTGFDDGKRKQEAGAFLAEHSAGA